MVLSFFALFPVFLPCQIPVPQASLMEDIEQWLAADVVSNGDETLTYYWGLGMVILSSSYRIPKGNVIETIRTLCTGI